MARAEHIRNLLALQGEHPAEAALLGREAGPRKRLTRVDSGVNETYAVALEGGLVAYHKPHEGLLPRTLHDFSQSYETPPLHECAAWQLAKALGPPFVELVVPAVYRELEGQWGSLSAHADGAPSPLVLLWPQAERHWHAAAMLSLRRLMRPGEF